MPSTAVLKFSPMWARSCASVPAEMAALTVKDVETRIITACKTIRALPDRERKFQILPNLWPEIQQDVNEAYGYTEAIFPRFVPTPADVSDCLVALAWARGIPRYEFKLIWWKSFGISHHQISLRLGRTPETARRRYRDVLLRVWLIAQNAN